MIGSDEIYVKLDTPFRKDLAVHSLLLLSSITGKTPAELILLSPSGLLELSCFGVIE